jgi:NAD(P)-dependent dehydrogenase (short-subunit alcohol dehydrogenase family)
VIYASRMTKQQPLGSGFGAKTTAREVLGDQRLDGRVVVVTGGAAGVGLETTRALAAAGATVVVGARSIDRANAALAGVSGVEVDVLDLAEPASVDAFAARFAASGRAIHALVANAGIMAAPLARDARGFESHLATNHLGHFQLTMRLWPALVRAGGARVVSLSSRGHARAGVDFDDPNFERRPYDKWLAYGQSKTANVLFAVALDARGAPHGVRAFAVHPGAIVTDLMRHLDPAEADAAVAAANKMPAGLKTAEQGAATSVWCATSPALDGLGGVYCEDVDVAAPAEETASVPRGVRAWAVDPEIAERLFRVSEEWTSARFEG